MKPVIIFRHAASEGPGYLATFLEAAGYSLAIGKNRSRRTAPVIHGGF